MVDSPRLPNAAPQGNPAASKASPSGALPGAEQRRVATFLSQEGSQGTFALGGRRFKASLQGAPSFRPGDQLLVEGGGEGKPLQVRELLRKEGQSLNQAALDRLWRGAAGRDQSPRSVSQKASQSTFSDPPSRTGPGSPRPQQPTSGPVPECPIREQPASGPRRKWHFL